MAKSAHINARVEKGLKTKAEKVLHNVGVNTSDAITMFLRQVVLTRGLPFEVRVPNAETRKAIARLEVGKGERFSGTTEAFFEHLLGEKRPHRRA